MLGITLQETRVYREIKEEGREQGREEGREQGREEGREEGREQGERILVLRQLNRRVGKLTPKMRETVETLSLTQLENLGEALLDFNNPADLETWLKSR
jgi:predicted transposase YdaD